MANSSFKIYSKGVCLLCLNSKNCRALVSDSGEDANSRTRTAFKMLLRYLKVDVGDNRVPSSKLLSEGWKGDIHLVALCVECSSVANDFLDLYQDFESIRIQLDLCVEQLHGFVEKGVKDLEFESLVNIGEMEDQESVKIMKDFRQKVIDKVSQKVGASLPRIAMGRIVEKPDVSLKSTNTSPVQVPVQIDHEDKGEPSWEAEKQYDSRMSAEERASMMDMDTTDSCCEISVNEAVGACAAVEDPHHPVSQEMTSDIETETTSAVLLERFENTIEICSENDDSLQFQPDTRTTITLEQMDESSSSPSSSFNSIQSGLAATPTPPSWECAYCHQECYRKDSLLAHQFHKHAMVLLSDEGLLPPNVSEQQMEATVEAILGQQQTSNFKCPLCQQGQKFQFKSDVRAHLLQFHFNHVLENVGKVPLESSPNSPPQEEDINKSWKCAPCNKEDSAEQLCEVLESTERVSKNVGRVSAHSPDITKICNQELERMSAPVKAIQIKELDKTPTTSTRSTDVSEEQLERCVALILGKLNPRHLQCPFCEGRGFRVKSEVRAHLLQRHLQQVLPNSSKSQGQDITGFNIPEDKVENSAHDQSTETGSGSSVLVEDDLPLASLEYQEPTSESVDPKLKTQQQLKCVYCDKQCSRSGGLIAHKFLKHTKDYLSDEGLLPPHFSEQDLETSLAAIFGKMSSRQPQCPFCERKRFQNKTGMRTHLLYAHLEHVLAKSRGGDGVVSSSSKTKTQPTSWECIPCENTFATRKTLQFHQLSYHTMSQLSSEGRLPPGISEEQLEKSLKSIIDQVDHSKLQCPLCHKKGFSKRFTLLRIHLLQSHLEEVLDSTENSESPQATITNENDSSTTKILPLENNTDLRCVPCGKSFTTTGHLKQHNLLKHTTSFITEKGLVPLGISEKQIESSLATILTEAGNQCPFCKTTAIQLPKRMKINIKAHLLLKHLPQFLERVKELSLANGSQVGGKDRSAQGRLPGLKLTATRKHISPSFLKRNLRQRTKTTVQSNPKPRVPVKILCGPQLLQKDTCGDVWKCVPCGKRFFQKSNFQTHQLKIHPKTALKKKLPPSISEENLITAADRIGRRVCKEMGDRGSQRMYGCVLCSNTKVRVDHYYLRVHVLRRHLDEVIKEVEESAVEQS